MRSSKKKKLRRRPSSIIPENDIQEAISKVYGRKDSVKGKWNAYMYLYRNNRIKL